MIQKFKKFINKKGRDRLNQIIDSVNNSKGNTSSSPSQKPLFPGNIFFGIITEDFNSCTSTFVGTLLDYENEPLGSTSPFHEIEVNCSLNDDTRAVEGNYFVCTIKKQDAKFYCIGIYGSYGTDNGSSTNPSFEDTTTTGIYWAELQSGLQPSGIIGVKLLDSDGEPEGDTFYVYLFATRATTITTNQWLWNTFENPSEGDKVLIANDQHGEYYIIQPTLIKRENCA